MLLRMCSRGRDVELTKSMCCCCFIPASARLVQPVSPRQRSVEVADCAVSGSGLGCSRHPS